MKGTSEEDNVMRPVLARLAFAAVVIASAAVFAVAPAKADDGSPFEPGDGRISPLTGDRVAVYCKDSGVDVWGVDSSNNGVYLTSFSAQELKSQATVTHNSPQGAVTLRFNSAAQTHYGYDTTTALSLIVDKGAQYSIAWAGGSYAASGAGAFVKGFSCTYLP
jgi:hypothetical protein